MRLENITKEELNTYSLFKGKLSIKQIKTIRRIESRSVPISECGRCVVQDIMLVLGVDLEGDCCGGYDRFQKYFRNCPCYCDITQAAANRFLDTVLEYKTRTIHI